MIAYFQIWQKMTVLYDLAILHRDRTELVRIAGPPWCGTAADGNASEQCLQKVTLDVEGGSGRVAQGVLLND